MISVIELKKYIASAGIFGVIVGKLYYRKKLCPIILLKINKSLKIRFYCTILLFDLTVCLWVEDARKFPLNAKEIA